MNCFGAFSASVVLNSHLTSLNTYGHPARIEELILFLTFQLSTAASLPSVCVFTHSKCFV